ncbi:uncharacterized protein LOC129732110 [Wyeomyia smithii]|uniref:uncharacterized protein LOC129732110 n=1 Tax=Wyeomyia smithii TaxID=174621 RepID=UPI0024682239|nr:uncharacterized protein LOC129732110 [Wyeomyia smithii]
MVCSIGLCLKQICTAGKRYRSSEQFSSHEWYLLKVRSGVECLETVCDSRANKFDRLYTIKQKHCCNPLNVHSTINRKNLKPVSALYHDKFNKHVKNVVEGRKICVQCDKAVRAAAKSPLRNDQLKEKIAEIDSKELSLPAETGRSSADVEVQDENDYAEINDSKLSSLNSTLASLGQSPISEAKVKRVKKYTADKHSKAAKALKSSFDAVLGPKSGQYETAGDEKIKQLKEKFRSCTDASVKIQILSVLPKSWTIAKIQKEFECPERLVRSMKKCVEEKGILCLPNPKKGHPLSEDVVRKVKEFYREPDVSKELAGRKEYKSVREGSTRVLKQKRLVLGNLNEMFAYFKDKFPEINIGFSKFAELRPPECVLAGAAGTHTVCVCAIHENFMFMFLGAKFDRTETADGEKAFTSYRDVLKLNLCNPPSEMCFLNRCTNTACGEMNSVRNIIWSYFDDNSIEEVIFKQWTQQFSGIKS